MANGARQDRYLPAPLLLPDCRGVAVSVAADVKPVFRLGVAPGDHVAEFLDDGDYLISVRRPVRSVSCARHGHIPIFLPRSPTPPSWAPATGSMTRRPCPVESPPHQRRSVRLWHPRLGCVGVSHKGAVSAPSEGLRGRVSMKAAAELIPQVFFDILARYVPGLVLVGSWILLLGQDDWPALLSTVVGGQLSSGNAFLTAALVLLFVPFVVGYVIAPFAKAVQRGNEHGWWLPPRPSRSVYESGERKWRPKDWWVLSDKAGEEGYDWLRENASDGGALSAKIRAEFTMYNALSVAFLAITVMACIAGEYPWAVASALATPLMAYRGATIEETFHSTTREHCKAANHENLGPAPRLIWLMPEDKGDYPLWEDGKGWLDVRTLNSSKELEIVGGVEHEPSREPASVDAVQLMLTEVGAWAREAADVHASSDRKRHRLNGKELARKLQSETGPAFTFRLHGSFWGIKLFRRARVWVTHRRGQAADDVAPDRVQR
jgi:hypothetical protein